jgi:hypothetical protein
LKQSVTVQDREHPALPTFYDTITTASA